MGGDRSSLTAFITGGGRGIGKEIARELWNLGMNIVIGDIIFENAKRSVMELDPEGERSLALPLDVTKSEDVFRAVEEILTRFERIDVLINNAGISPQKGNLRKNISEISEEEWDRVIGVNLKGVFNCSKAIMKNMMKNRYGKIVNIASVAGITGGFTGPAGAHYVASKAGVIALTKVLAAELAPFGIQVNAVAPGRIQGTGFSFEITQQELDKTIKEIPIGRIGNLKDVAKLVAFLVSEDASFIVGETIVIDGGRLLK